MDKLWEFPDFIPYAIGHERNLAEEVGYPRGLAGGESRANGVLLSAEGAGIPLMHTPAGSLRGR